MTSRGAGSDTTSLDVTGSPASPSRFRTGRWFLLAEGVLAGALAAGFMADASLWGLTLTPVRGSLLFLFGVLAVAASLNRRAALIVTAAAIAVSLALTAMAESALAFGVPRAWGIDPQNAALYTGLLVYNIVLIIWLIPDIGDRGTGDVRITGSPKHVAEK